MDRPAEAEPITRPAWKDRLKDALAVANGWGLAALNALLLGTVLVVLLSSDRSALTAVVIVVWGAVACFLAFRAGCLQKPALDSLKVVLAYALGTLVVFLILNGLYRLLGW